MVFNVIVLLIDIILIFYLIFDFIRMKLYQKRELEKMIREYDKTTDRLLENLRK